MVLPFCGDHEWSDLKFRIQPDGGYDFITEAVSVSEYENDWLIWIQEPIYAYGSATSPISIRGSISNLAVVETTFCNLDSFVTLDWFSIWNFSLEFQKGLIQSIVANSCNKEFHANKTFATVLIGNNTKANIWDGRLTRTSLADIVSSLSRTSFFGS